ncbi:hypothetical protein M8C17_01080 [Micromonospora sp. RHAY321]|uniref:hypothetical protein n=1 Tax=Micromonospora sp. RHAY321 TaxID=2944807 RepID=UPI00207C7A21|nr:hypothetical protein [Micromonospora sp. RHAY321]MCO1593755.1 hypothetical protein [Micromonospora sp. RHAY321]
MRSRHRAAAIGAALTAVEHDANSRGWDALPALLGLFDATTDRHQPHIAIDVLGVDPAFWWLHEQTVPGMRLPYGVGLKTLTAHLVGPDAPATLARWAGQRRLAGMAFLAEGLDTSDAGRRDAAAHGLCAGPDGVPVRVLTACDVDGRHYQILRVRGAATTRTTILDDPPARVRASVIPACLHRLLAAARP